VDNVTLLKTLPPTGEIEGKLRQSGAALLAGSELVAVLDRYSKARAALARSVAEAGVKAMGLAVAAASDELPRHEAERVARECAAYLEALVND
jgi:hypothetical protein